MLREAFVLVGFSVGVICAFRSAFAALLLYLATAYFRPEQWVWTDRIAQMNLSMLAGVLLLGSTLVHERRFRFNGPLLLVALFFVQALISTITSETPDWSWRYWQDLAKVLVVVYLIPVIVSTPARLRGAFIVIALALGLEQAKQGWVGFLAGANRNINEHPMLGDNNGVALAMMMLLPILGALTQTASSVWERSMYRFVFVGVLLRGFLTYSRGGFVAAAAVALYHIARSRHRIRLLTLIVTASVLLFSALPDTFWDRMGTIRDSPEEQDSSAQGRLHFWRVAVDMVAAHPLTGVGVNGFQTSYNAYDTSLGDYGFGRAVHSTWFGVLSELGVFGFGLFLAVLLSAFLACRSVRRTSKSNPDVAALLPYAVGIEGALIAYVAGGTFLNAQYLEMFWHLIGLATAARILATQAVRQESKERTPTVAHVQAKWAGALR